MTDGPAGRIRVLIVDDSPVACEMISRIVLFDSLLEVVGVARDGRQAIRAAARLSPDIITMDIYMPGMDGLAAIQEIMAERPCPILVVTSDRNSKLAYRALACGALDVIDKPRFEEDATRESYSEFLDQLKLLSRVRVITHVRGRKGRFSDALPPLKRDDAPAPCVVGIAASTGGPSALAAILGSLGDPIQAAFVVVQHMSEGFTQGLVQWLDEISPMTVREALHGDLLKPRTVYVAPTDQHAEVARGGRISLSRKPLVKGHRPSADLLFQSLAKVYAEQATGVILTGMGADGAHGLMELRSVGGVTIAQDESTSLIYGMPKVAVAIGAVQHVLPLNEIAAAIKKLYRR